MPRITYETDAKGNIVLPDGPPFDGKPVLIRLANGWCEAWWDDARTVQHQEGVEHEGFSWVCLDDQFSEELDDAKDWLPLPEYQHVSIEPQPPAAHGNSAEQATMVKP